MSATERIRAMLDERGVEWMPVAWSPKRETFYHAANGVGFCADEYTDGVKIYTDSTITPEQAVEATLGRGECHPVISDNLAESEGTGDAWADCSECGHLLFVLTDPTSEPPAYCPGCGAKVVGPTTNGADAGVTNG